METRGIQQPDSFQVFPQATTPELNLQADNPIDLSFSSSDESFESSPNGGTESSSLSNDSESEYFSSAINGYLDTVRQMSDREQLQKKGKTMIEPISMNLSSDEVEADVCAKEGEYGNREELIGRILQYEGELEVLNLKLQKSEGEVVMLKDALNKSDIAAHDLKVQLEAMKIEMEKKGANLDEATCKILHLKTQIHELETHIAHSHCKTEMLINELSQAEENLGRSKENVAALSAGLDLERQKTVELQERIFTYQKEVSGRENEILMLLSAYSQAEGKHSVEKEELIEQWESQYKQLEENFRQREDEMKELHHALVRDMQEHISNSKVEVEERETQIDRLNKELDMLKLKHDMVVAEGDGLSARIQALLVELNCRDNHVKELTVATASLQEVASMLKSRVQALEDEVEMQKILISDGDEKKREAIRQLCFSLEHYRIGYHELREAFWGRSKRRAVFAS